MHPTGNSLPSLIGSMRSRRRMHHWAWQLLCTPQCKDENSEVRSTLGYTNMLLNRSREDAPEDSDDQGTHLPLGVLSGIAITEVLLFMVVIAVFYFCVKRYHHRTGPVTILRTPDFSNRFLFPQPSESSSARWSPTSHLAVTPSPGQNQRQSRKSVQRSPTIKTANMKANGISSRCTETLSQQSTVRVIDAWEESPSLYYKFNNIPCYEEASTRFNVPSSSGGSLNISTITKPSTHVPYFRETAKELATLATAEKRPSNYKKTLVTLNCAHTKPPCRTTAQIHNNNTPDLCCKCIISEDRDVAVYPITGTPPPDYSPAPSRRVGSSSAGYGTSTDCSLEEFRSDLGTDLDKNLDHGLHIREAQRSPERYRPRPYGHVNVSGIRMGTRCLQSMCVSECVVDDSFV